MEKKVCSRCKIEKEFTEFHKGNDKFGYQRMCKICKKKYQQSNVDKENTRKKEWAEKNKEKVDLAKKKYYKKNAKQEIFKGTKRANERKKVDIVYKLSCNLRTRTTEFLRQKSFNKTAKTFKYIGCSPEYLKEYLENKFSHGMSWENYGEWHIDHIIPLSSAKNEDDVYRLCHFSNLQPLWALDNLKKGDRIL